MDQETKQRLEGALKRKAEADRRETEARQTREAAQAEEQAKIKLARERWPTSLAELEAAVSKINAEIENHRLSLRIEAEKDAVPAIAQLRVVLTGGKADSYIQVSVNALGTIQTSFHLGRSRATSPNLAVETADQETYLKVLVHFLDLAV